VCLWRQPFECNLINYATNFINLEVTKQQQQQQQQQQQHRWRFTGFYVFPEIERRRDSWDLLRTLDQDNNLPWCIMGDFDDILSNEDKYSHVDHPP
jgi:hypothetical protein